MLPSHRHDAAAPPANARRFTFASEAYDDAAFEVVDLTGRDAISQPYRFELTLVSEQPRIDFAKMLSRGATLTILPPYGDAGTTRYAGVLAEFEQLNGFRNLTVYRATLVPRLWRLSLYKASDVYLNEQTIPDIVKQVLRGASFGSRDYRLRHGSGYRKRSFVCQYDESHLDFVSRWMEKEGLYYYFEHDGKRETLAIVDDRRYQPGPADDLALRYLPAADFDTGIESNRVQAFACRATPLPREVVLRDFNHRKAELPLEVRERVSRDGIGERVSSDEHFHTKDEGRRYAKLRAEALVCEGRRFSGEATAAGLRAGRFVALAGHYRADFDGRYLVTAVTHRGSQAGLLFPDLGTPFGATPGAPVYRAEFDAIAADVQYRPPRATPKPRAAGVISAIVDGEGGGKLAELDEYGQYKVRFPFAHTAHPANQGSARIRMATPYAGADRGMHLPLLKRTEVKIAFDGGDPDRPVIVGAVPNSSHRSVVTRRNPAAHRILTEHNQLYMKDGSGAATWLHAPNNHIGIGAVGPGGGLALLTSGNKFDFSLGNAYSFSGGLKCSVSMGGNTDVYVGVRNSLDVSANFLTTLQGNLRWMLPGSRTFEINDSASTLLQTLHKQSATGAIRLSAGQDASALLQKQLDKLKGTVRKFMIVSGLANAGSAAAAAGLIKGGGAVADLPWAGFGISAAQFAGASAVSTALMATARTLLANVAKLQEALPLVADLSLGKHGIALAAKNLTHATRMSLAVDGLTWSTHAKGPGAAGVAMSAGKGRWGVESAKHAHVHASDTLLFAVPADPATRLDLKDLIGLRRDLDACVKDIADLEADISENEVLSTRQNAFGVSALVPTPPSPADAVAAVAIKAKEAKLAGLNAKHRLVTLKIDNLQQKLEKHVNNLSAVRMSASGAQLGFKGNRLVATADGVTLAHAQGKAKLDVREAKIGVVAGKSSVELDEGKIAAGCGSASLKLGSDGAIDVRATNVKLNGSASLKFDGQLIQLG
ncbi:type VI secretion system tip protein VgrG [Burkholderia humptydooensis]|uniref:Type VI secretion system tip protein VgrG n=2 Tax=Burkholderia humptydooensis TaxID=430531 RepID=A0A7U4P9D9_9BURK|nr:MULTISPECIES: type VI secretion system tip protein TssI/VgrG [Burkholderia]AJY39587.1 Rhs element Vgr family protein [Burkholderia sp. 2002721687]ALX45399.1 type IV secretion protein Rhs [Burkholderia humptydooensis]EIP85404.1 Rhs element Vgr protein [Burkholderia humptydooensis MSMB43]QPS46871.1 type VI secretion system tip protein VgrG [Burkholderia humptydooensis]